MPRILEIDPRGHRLPLFLLASLRASIARAGVPFASRSLTWKSQLRPFGPWSEDWSDRTRPVDTYAGGFEASWAGENPCDGCWGGCHNFFPPGGGMGWHTDSGRPGWRVYVHCHGPEPGGSVMHYREYQIAEPPVGAVLFETGPGCWHAVTTACGRYSLGVQIPDTLVGELLKTNYQP